MTIDCPHMNKSSLCKYYLLILLCLSFQAWADTVNVVVDYQGRWSSELKKNVSLFLSIATIKPKDSVSPFRIRKLHKQANAEITTALQAYGYYRPVITTALSQTTSQQWRAEYTIEPGIQTHIRYRTIAVTGPGRNTIDLVKVLSTSKIKPNAPLLHQNYAALKKQLSETLYHAGYLDQHFTKTELKIFPDLALADIELILDTGQPYYFGKVTIDQTILEPDFIEQFIPFKPGDLLDSNKLLQLQFNLNDSRFFNHVEINTHREATQDFYIPIEVITTPSKPQKYSVGLGYGTDTGPRLKLGAEFLRINRTGHQITSELSVSPIANDFAINYRIPFHEVVHDYWNFSARESSEQISQSNHNSDSLLLGASRNETIWQGNRRLYLNYEKTHFTIDTIDQSEFLIPGIEWSTTKTNNTLYPTRGYKISIDVHGAYDQIIASTSFIRADVNASKIIPLASNSRLLLNGEWGTVRSKNFDRLPPSQRFFSGGDRTIRGYSYLALGPVTDLGDAKGGTFLSRGSIELETLLYKNFGASVFYDAGSVTEHPEFDFKTSVGAGFRWRSPVGMLRIDFSHPLDDPTTRYRAHFSIGPDL